MHVPAARSGMQSTIMLEYFQQYTRLVNDYAMALLQKGIALSEK